MSQSESFPPASLRPPLPSLLSPPVVLALDPAALALAAGQLRVALSGSFGPHRRHHDRLGDLREEPLPPSPRTTG
jgi:hypothetical protein